MSSRREFLKNMGRIMLLSGLTAGVAGLATRKGASSPKDDTCRRDGVCRNCPLLKGCGHPTALSFKEAKGR